jgi:thiol-disulfide isomerase/thioredoxin
MNTDNLPPKRGTTGIAIAVVIAIAAALGFFLQKHLRQPASLTAAAPATQTASTSTPAPHGGETAVAAETTEPAQKMPEVVPAIELKDTTGKLRRLSDWKGQPMVVNFWATWCPPCVREIPLLVKFRHQRARQKVAVVGIAVDFREDVLKFVGEHTLDYPLLIGEEDGLAAVKAVGMEVGFPFTLFVDSQQRIIAVKVGELHQDELDLIVDRVIAIDSGKLALADARTQISEGLKALSTQRSLNEAAEAARQPPPLA